MTFHPITSTYTVDPHAKALAAYEAALVRYRSTRTHRALAALQAANFALLAVECGRG